MLEKNKFNPPCSYSELVIAYFYKEIEASEKNDFEVHLPNCAVCIDELSGFETVHSSISEWRSVEFDHLETPAFNFLRCDKEEVIIDSVLAEKNWWVNLRDRYFSPSPIWAASAFAALLICFGLTYLLFNPQNTEVAEINSTANSNIISSAKETNNNLSAGNDSGLNLNAKSAENFSGEEQQSNVQTTTASSNASGAGNYAVKIASKSNRTANRKSGGAKKSTSTNRTPGDSGDARKTPSSKSRSAPFLADIEEVEDDTLRLADLFDDTDAE